MEWKKEESECTRRDGLSQVRPQVLAESRTVHSNRNTAGEMQWFNLWCFDLFVSEKGSCVSQSDLQLYVTMTVSFYGQFDTT